jgi:hypothetical protein
MKRILTTLTAFIFLIASTILLFLLLPPKPKADWDFSSEARIITVGYRGEVDYNYIPDVQVWGDGHIVWVIHDPNGNRRVLEGYLSQEKMKDLINQFIDADFFEGYRRFDWDTDFGQYISINLSNISHEITEADDINNSIDRLVGFLKSGAGVKGTNLIPTNGKLIVYKYREVELPDDIEVKYKWPDDKFEYGLESIHSKKPHNEIQISGEELEFAWEIVNTSSPLVESNGEVYWIAVVIPKVSSF